MEWFGITCWGKSNPFEKCTKDSYEEPMKQKDMIEMYESTEKRGDFAMFLSEIDVYIGQADGYAYNSSERLCKMRKKGRFKPVGPPDMYNKPLTCAMDYGWFVGDPDLKNQNWYKSENKFK